MIVVAVVVGGIGFYSGIQYGQSAAQASLQAARQARGSQFGGGAGGGARGGTQANGGGFATGDVIAKDEKSITIQLRAGGSKIVFFSATTGISKSATGTAQDIAVGSQVTVAGSANADGSITAQSIQLRSAMPPASQ